MPCNDTLHATFVIHTFQTVGKLTTTLNEDLT